MKRIAIINVFAAILFLHFETVKDVFLLYSFVAFTLSWQILILVRYLLRDKEQAVFLHAGEYKTLWFNIGTLGFLMYFSQFLMFRNIKESGDLARDSYALLGLNINTRSFGIVLACVFSALNVLRVRKHRSLELLWSSIATIWLVLPLGIASSNFLTMTIPVIFLAGNQGPDHFNSSHIKGGERSLRILKFLHFLIATFYALLALWVSRE